MKNSSTLPVVLAGLAFSTVVGAAALASPDAYAEKPKTTVASTARRGTLEQRVEIDTSIPAGEAAAKAKKAKSRGYATTDESVIPDDQLLHINGVRRALNSTNLVYRAGSVVRTRDGEYDPSNSYDLFMIQGIKGKAADKRPVIAKMKGIKGAKDGEKKTYLRDYHDPSHYEVVEYANLGNMLSAARRLTFTNYEFKKLIMANNARKGEGSINPEEIYVLRYRTTNKLDDVVQASFDEGFGPDAFDVLIPCSTNGVCVGLNGKPVRHVSPRNSQRISVGNGVELRHPRIDPVGLSASGAKLPIEDVGLLYNPEISDFEVIVYKGKPISVFIVPHDLYGRSVVGKGTLAYQQPQDEPEQPGYMIPRRGNQPTKPKDDAPRRQVDSEKQNRGTTVQNIEPEPVKRTQTPPPTKPADKQPTADDSDECDDSCDEEQPAKVVPGPQGPKGDKGDKGDCVPGPIVPPTPGPIHGPYVPPTPRPAPVPAPIPGPSPIVIPEQLTLPRLLLGFEGGYVAKGNFLPKDAYIVGINLPIRVADKLYLVPGFAYGRTISSKNIPDAILSGRTTPDNFGMYGIYDVGDRVSAQLFIPKLELRYEILRGVQLALGGSAYIARITTDHYRNERQYYPDGKLADESLHSGPSRTDTKVKPFVDGGLSIKIPKTDITLDARCGVDVTGSKSWYCTGGVTIPLSGRKRK